MDEIIIESMENDENINHQKKIIDEAAERLAAIMVMAIDEKYRTTKSSGSKEEDLDKPPSNQKVKSA
jgi:DNA-binding ferritin-like protein